MTTSRSEAQEFEALIARIEAIALPNCALITARDRLQNSRTGSLQEVDVSIRHRIATVDILITIECRKRGRREDIRWIQELVSKRADLNINKMIAVSANGFTKNAHQLASQHGIELRTISEISTTEMEGWFLASGVVHLFRKIQQMECCVYLLCTDGGPTDYGMQIRDEFEPIFFHKGIRSPFPAATLFHLYEMENDDKFLADPRDKALKKIHFGIDGNLSVKGVPDRLSVTGPSGTNTRYAVHFVFFKASFGYEFAEFELDSGKHVRYSFPGGEVQRSTFGSQLFGLPFEFEHQRGPEDADHVAFRVLKRSEPEAYPPVERTRKNREQET